MKATGRGSESLGFQAHHKYLLCKHPSLFKGSEAKQTLWKCHKLSWERNRLWKQEPHNHRQQAYCELYKSTDRKPMPILVGFLGGAGFAECTE